jgi:hypothetical protein
LLATALGMGDFPPILPDGRGTCTAIREAGSGTQTSVNNLSFAGLEPHDLSSSGAASV